MDTSDIDLGSPRHKQALFTNEQDRRMRTRLVSEDIVGSTPRQLAPHRDLSFHNAPGLPSIPRAGDSLSAADISEATMRLPYNMKHSTRQSGPLDPTYRYDVPTINGPPSLRPAPHDVSHGLTRFQETWHIGPITNLRAERYATGATRLEQHVGERANMLDASDIEGTAVGSKGSYTMRTSPFRHSASYTSRALEIDDIPGTRSKGPFTLVPAFELTRRKQE
jgi:hypothetical protein|eukprot:Tamp_13323.p1 GENE.Tamp_13323~~Tamp_13323.p1  ORF type:complete len:222 (+),score=33.53 Tamp_13323:981-1646(+)